MPFIIVFNIIMTVIITGVLVTVMGCSVIIRDNKKKNNDRALKTVEKTEKVRAISYLVFVGTILLTILMNLIF